MEFCFCNFPQTLALNTCPTWRLTLEKLPKEIRFAVEVRNKNLLNQTFYSVLETNRVALVWADNLLMSEISAITTNFLYFRWEGNRKKVNGTLGKIEADRIEDLKSEAERIQLFLKKMDVFGYFGKYYSGYPPSDVINIQSFL